MTRFSKQLRILAAGVILALGAGATTSAYAGPFTVDPGNLTGLGSGLGPFTADSMGGTSSTLITTTNGVNYTATGYIDFTAFSYQSNAISAGHSGLNDAYGMYAVFTQTFVCPTALNTGVSCGAQTISLSLYANPGDNDTFTQATLGGPAPTHTEVSASDILLGTGSYVVDGTAGINVLGGAFENVNTNFVLTGAGSEFFTAPVPFYDFAFSEYNNTSTGLACNATGCAVTFETGSTDFTNAPEPASLAIFGLGLVALTVLRRKSV